MISNWAEFEKELTERMVDSINSLRELQSLTVKELAARLREVGWAVSDSTLAGILSGRKRSSISVGETFAFARALNVSPTFLILGLPHTATLPSFPSLWGTDDYSTVDAAAWFRGYTQPPAVGDTEAVTPARHGFEVITYYSNTRQAVRWQAALFTAAGNYSSDELREINVSREILRKRLERVSRNLVEDHASLDGYGLWEVPLPDLPSRFVGVAADEVSDLISAMSDDDIRSLTRDSDLDRARDFLAHNLREATSGGHRGASANPAE